MMTRFIGNFQWVFGGWPGDEMYQEERLVLKQIKLSENPGRWSGGPL